MAKKIMIKKTERKSLNVKTDLIVRLKGILPEVFSEGKINWDRLRQALGEHVDVGAEKFAFTWAGKSGAIKNVLVPSKMTLTPAKKESIKFDEGENVFIEGDNLEALKLLQKAYFEKVKMIYIDPPYNTGNDFVYRDDFKSPLKNYLEQTDQVDSYGNRLQTNTQASGRYHSDWLNMLYPRLKMAWSLLRHDGVIFISIDDNEMHHLRSMMDEIFGEECFKSAIIFKRGIKNVQAQFETIDSLTIGHEYVLMYAKSPETRFKQFSVELEESKEGGWNNHWRGTDRPTMRYELFDTIPKTGQWRWGKERSFRAISNYQRALKELSVKNSEVKQSDIDQWWKKEYEKAGEEADLLRLSSNNKPEHYIPPSDTKLGSDLWTDLSPRGSSELLNIFKKKIFDNPKPVGLIKRMVEFITNSSTNDIILDFFAGSGSTAHAVFAQNQEDKGDRRFILVQMPEMTDPRSEAHKAGYKTIADIAKERIRRVIKGYGDDPKPISDGFKVFKLDKSCYAENLFEYDPEKSDEDNEKAFRKYLENSKDLFARLDAKDEMNLVYESIVKEGLNLNAKISEETIGKNKVFKVSDGDREILISLDKEIHKSTVEALKDKAFKEKIFIAFDTALDDSQKANLALNLSLKTI